MISTFGITIVVSQEYLPSRLSTAAGLSIGLSIGLGGVASFAIGRLADSIGLVDALWTIPPAALLGAALCALLPAPDAAAVHALAAVDALRGARRATTRSEALAAGRFDLLVVGGGIVGCAVAWLGARAGLRVALVERGDLAGATSSASSKLIHGGLRYLQMGDIGLVREAHAERHALARVVAPHLVRPRAFLVPVYRGGPVRATKLRAGLVLYGGLGRFEDGGGSLLRPRAARALVPSAAYRRPALGRALRRSRDQRRAHDDRRRARRGARGRPHRHAGRGARAAARRRPRRRRRMHGCARRRRSCPSRRPASSTRPARGSTSCGAWPIPPRRARCASPRART